SVANYFAEHGWRQGGRVALPVEVDGEAYRPLVAQGYKPHTPVDALPGYGVRVSGDLDGAQLAALLELDAENGPEHWLVLHNFYVITRYNHSPLYAMAVYQLSEAIAARRDAEPEPDGRG
ncbi:MAG: lytic murein transglycosylase, partial [Gammaproteobacteria bacterium]|nr:lytic murein transglycosylase [Gammaproteobacteria bacterium]